MIIKQLVDGVNEWNLRDELKFAIELENRKVSFFLTQSVMASGTLLSYGDSYSSFKWSDE